jgi:periplasmic copper chaperone A
MRPRPSSGGRGFFICAAAWLLLACGAAEPSPESLASTAGSIQVVAVRASATPPGASVGAVYLSITNRAAKPDALIGLTSPVAATVEVHRSAMVQGVMQMRQVAVLECPPGVTNLQPGALHIMLLGLKQPLVEGATFPLSLKFRDAGMLVVQVPVKAWTGG